MLGRIIAGVLSVAACSPMPIGIVDAPPTRIPQPSLVTSTPPGFCAEVHQAEVEKVIGQPVQVDTESSGPRVCTFSAANREGEQFFVVVRVEDIFDDLDGPEAVFPSGTRHDIGTAAYWAPSVQTLWVDQGEDIYAVQLVSYERPDEDALRISTDIARLLAR
jgi:sucrose-6-phosphate hydrolase SacC (GH32 family)